MPNILSTIKLPLHTACLAFCPESQEGWLAVGSYELSECRTFRRGRLHILECADSPAEGILVKEIFSYDLPGAGVSVFLGDNVMENMRHIGSINQRVWSVQASLI